VFHVTKRGLLKRTKKKKKGKKFRERRGEEEDCVFEKKHPYYLSSGKSGLMG
jgi:hypothetical protein